MANRTYRDSPFGIAVYPHLNEPDAKFNPESPLFKTGLRLTGEAAQKMKALVDDEAEAAFADYFESGDGKKLSDKQRADWKVYRPYEEDEEGDGIVFDFKQNAIIKMRDGTVKHIEIGIYDATGKEMHKLVRGGSEIRVNYTLRPITMKSLKMVGVRADFGRVQVKTLSEGNAGGFGAVDGYVDDGGPGTPHGEQPVGPESEY